MKTTKIIYWASTLVLCGIFAFSINIHLFRTEMVEGFYTGLGFPSWIVLPNGILKVAAIIAILSNVSKFLKEWAYAGLFFDAVLAFTAHQVASDGGYVFSLIAIIALVISRIFWGKLSQAQGREES